MASSRTSLRAPPSPESFESLSRRNAAAAILQSYEKLSWYSQQRCESLVQTRMHFQNIIAGLTPADEEDLVYWKTENTPHPEKVARDAEKKRLAAEQLRSEGVTGGGRVTGEDDRRKSGTASFSKKRKSRGDAA